MQIELHAERNGVTATLPTLGIVKILPNAQGKPQVCFGMTDETVYAPDGKASVVKRALTSVELPTPTTASAVALLEHLTAASVGEESTRLRREFDRKGKPVMRGKLTIAVGETLADVSLTVRAARSAVRVYVSGSLAGKASVSDATESVLDALGI